MSSPLPASTFKLLGEYCGFIRTLLGKKRMVLRIAGEEAFLKVPKELRRRLQSSLAPGTEIAVTGIEIPDPQKGRPKRVVTDVRFASNGLPCALCPIRICTKKNCWRQGGRELWAAVELAVAERGLAGSVRLEGVECLDHCKQAPNAACNDREFHQCTIEDVERIIASAAGEEARPGHPHA